MAEDPSDIRRLENRLGHSFQSESLLQEALTHASAGPVHNERLEFLGDAVIDLVVATVLSSLGMVMLPPTLVSLPVKLLVFVMADGWNVLVMSLLRGVAV